MVTSSCTHSFICGVGCVLQSKAHGGSIKVNPLMCGQCGLLETHGEGSPIAAIFLEMWDSGGEDWEGHCE